MFKTGRMPAAYGGGMEVIHMHHLDRRTLLRASIGAAAAGLILRSGLAHAAEPPNDVSFVQDFDELWRTLAERYCYFSEKRTDWNRVRALYRPMADRADSQDAFAAVVRNVLNELYDAHTHAFDTPDGEPRYPFYDLLVEPEGNAIRIAAIAQDSATANSGLAIGDRITAIDGKSIAEVLRSLMPRCLTRPDPAADHYAANAAVSGRVGQPRRFQLSTGREILLPLKPRAQKPNLEWRRLEGGLCSIVIRSFADDAVVAAFDEALVALRDAPGLIIDVRYNGGGDTAVARPIMGRFIKETKPYALMRRRAGKGLSAPWTEYVEPRGPFTYEGPVAVLTSSWSASMAEGFPMGMRGIGRARIIGTRMMGLGAGVFRVRLDRTGIEAQYSGEPVYDVHGQPRTLLRPDVEVPAGEDSLKAAIALLSSG